MTTPTDAISEIRKRAETGGYRHSVPTAELADIQTLLRAYDEAVAGVARLRAGMEAIGMECTALHPNQRRIYEIMRDHTDLRGSSSWPQDLLEAVRLVADDEHTQACDSHRLQFGDGCLEPCAQRRGKARATLSRYGLL